MDMGSVHTEHANNNRRRTIKSHLERGWPWMLGPRGGGFFRSEGRWVVGYGNPLTYKCRAETQNDDNEREIRKSVDISFT